MKRFISIGNIISLVTWILALLLVSACVPELPEALRNSGKLIVSPVVNGSTLTKAVGDRVPDTANESDLLTLDVFVKGVTNPSFWKTYHLTVADDNLQAAVNNLLASNWKEDGYVENDKYDVYVVANHDCSTVTSLDALKALRDNEFDRATCIWSDGTLNPAKLTLHKTYKGDYVFDPDNSYLDRVFTASKKYMMDGVVHNWSPSGSGDQVIDVNLDRAASRFEVNVDFSEAFLAELAEKNMSVTGEPAWRFINFAFDAPVIDPEKYGSTTSEAENVLSSGALIRGNAAFSQVEGERKKFTITTYSYPRKWALDEAVQMAPALVISVGYQKTGETSPSFNYYRIPIVDQTTTTEIGRNKIYRVSATISSLGSTSLEDLTDMIVDYAVIPWNDPDHSGNKPADVVSTERLYLQVTPHTYVLRGDGTQTVDLTYYLPQGKHVKIQYFTTQADNEKIAEGQAVGNTGSAYVNGTSPAAWYYNKDDAFRQTFVGNPVQVSVLDNNTAGNIEKGTITVSSKSLANKAIKYIAFRVYLDVPDWYNKQLYRDIFIRHFPTDNIQAISGSWSSRVEYEYSNTPVDGWIPESYTTYRTPAEYLADQTNIQRINHETLGPGNNDSYYQRYDWSYDIYNNYDDYYYLSWPTSEANAVLYNGYYYWRTQTGNGVNRRYTFHRAQYVSSGTHYKNPNSTSTGDWVDWERDNAQTYSSNMPHTYDGTGNQNGNYGHYMAKVYNQTDNNIYAIAVTRSGNGNYYSPYTYTYSRATSQAAGNWYTINDDGNYVRPNSNMHLSNNHMYVIQITRTSSTYVLGRPELDGKSQSKDHVVSPAFMIASQLGAVTTFDTGESAASHCAKYMEVATDGTRYVGWRLPTVEEVNVIIKYQGTNANSVTIDNVVINNTDDRILVPVLTGYAYWTLSGDLARTDYEGGTNNAVRCVRDMSAEEIAALNKIE